MKNKSIDINIVNRKSKFDYTFIRTETAGIKLIGTEVKSIREGKVTLTDSYCIFSGDELIVKNINIQTTEKYFSHSPLDDRKLLLRKKELKKLKSELIKGLSIIPYRLFINDRGLIKLEIALCKGKKDYDKRETIKKRDIEKNIKKDLVY